MRVIALSQSGSSSNILASLVALRKAGALTLAVSNFERLYPLT